MASVRGALPRLHIPSHPNDPTSHAQSQPHQAPFTPSSTVLSLGQRFGGPQTAGPAHQRFGSIQIPVRRGDVGHGGGPLPSAGLVPSSPFGGGPGWGGGGGPMPMTAAASSFPASSHQQMASMSGGGQLGRFARLRQGHGRTQSIGPPPKAALGGAGAYTSAARAQALTPSTEAVPPAPTEPVPPKKKKVVVKLPSTNESDAPPLWSRTAASVEGDGGPRNRALGETLEPEIASREVSPEEDVQGELVSLDVYLPGKRFWKVMQEERIQARLASLGVVDVGAMSPYSPQQAPFSHLSPFGSPHPFGGSPSMLSAPSPRLPSPLSNPSLSPVSNLSPGQRLRPLPPHLLSTQPQNPYFPRLAEPQPQYLSAPSTQPVFPPATRLNPAQAPFVPPGANRLNPAQTPFIPRAAVHAAPFVPSVAHPVFTSPFRQDPALVFGHESVSEDTEGEEEEARISASEEEEGQRRLDNHEWEGDVDDELLDAVRLEAGEDTAGLGTAREAQMPVQKRVAVDDGDVADTEDDEMRVRDMAGFGDEEEEEGSETARAEPQLVEKEDSNETQGSRKEWDDGSDVESRSDGEYSNPSDEDRHIARQASRRVAQAEQVRHLHTSTFGSRRRSAEIVSNPSDEEDNHDEGPSALREVHDAHQRLPSHAQSAGTASGSGSLSPTKSSGTAPNLNPLARPFSFCSAPAPAPAPVALPVSSTFDPRARPFDPSSIRRVSNPSVFNTAASSMSRTPTYFTADEGSPRNPANLIPSMPTVPSTLRGTFNPAAAEFRPIQAVAQIDSQRSSVDLGRSLRFGPPAVPPPALSLPPPPQRAFGSVSRPLPTPPQATITSPGQDEERADYERDKRDKQPTDELLDGTSLASRRAFHSPHTSPERPLQILAGGDIDRLESFKMPVGAVIPVELSPEVKFKAFKMPVGGAGRTPTSPDRARFVLGLTLADGLAPSVRPPSSVGRRDEEIAQTLLLPPPPAPANTLTSLNSAGAGERFRRAPIPMFSSAAAPLPAAPHSPGVEANTRASVRSRMDSRDASNLFFHQPTDSVDDSFSDMPAISQRDPLRLRAPTTMTTTTWEDEIEDASLSAFAGRAGGGGGGRRTSVETRARSSSDALPAGELSSEESSSPTAAVDDLVRRITQIIDDKLTSLRTSDVTGGFVHLSSLHPDAEDALVARIVGTLLEDRLDVEEDDEDANRGIDVEQVRTVVEDGYRAVCERVEGSIVEALRNLDLPTSSSLASLSIGHQDIASLQIQASRSHQMLEHVLGQVQDSSAKVDAQLAQLAQQPAAPGLDATLIADLVAALGPSMHAAKVDVEALSESITSALSPLLSVSQPTATPSIQSEEVVDLLLPHLDRLRPKAFDDEAFALKLSTSLPGLLSDKIESALTLARPPTFDTAKLVKDLAASLPATPGPVDLSGVNSKLEDVLSLVGKAAAAYAQRDSRQSETSALQSELEGLKAALRETKSVSDLHSERAKVAEAERTRLASELETSRKAGLDDLAFKLESNLAKIRSDHALAELKARLKTAEDEREASLEREKKYKKENEDRAKEHSKLKLRSQVTENELEQAKKTIGINQRTWAQFQATTTDQLSALVKTVAAAEARSKEEVVTNKDELRRLTTETASLEKKLHTSEEKLIAQSHAAAAAAGSAKQAQASLSQELDRRVREVDAVREELAVVRSTADASEEDVQGLRSALQEREGRLSTAEDSQRTLRSSLREAEHTIRTLQADLTRHRSSRTPTAGLPLGSSWANYTPAFPSQTTPVNGARAPSSIGSPSAVVHRLQQQVLTPPGSNFRHPPLPSMHSPSGFAGGGDAGYYSTPTRGGGGGGEGMGKGASGSMHAPVPGRPGVMGGAAGGRGPSATPISRVGTVKPPESEDGWWGED